LAGEQYWALTGDRWIERNGRHGSNAPISGRFGERQHFCEAAIRGPSGERRGWVESCRFSLVCIPHKYLVANLYREGLGKLDLATISKDARLSDSIRHIDIS
jgi:hypothetical protein